jgi:hypothetical protein
MALVFACLSMDETAQIHETINLPLRHLLHNRMTLPWTLPAGAFVLAFALYFLRFLRSLPPPTRWRFVAAGCIYVGGSIGMELVSGHYSSTHGVNMTYAILAGVEELLEMWGVTLFVYALLAHMHSEATEVRFTFVTSAGSGPARAAAAR